MGIGFFPEPYPDELFYSIVARLQRLLRVPAQVAVRLLFGSNDVHPTRLHPVRLSRFVAALPATHTYSSIDFVRRHSLLPYFALFVPSDRLTNMTQSMIGDESRHLAALSRLGIPPNVYLRFCPLCAGEDREDFGETYWHRVHQAPGVSVCARHAIFLEESAISLTFHEGAHRLVRAEEAVAARVPRPANPNSPDDLLALGVARQAEWLLARQDSLTPMGPVKLRDLYWNMLDRQGAKPFGQNLNLSARLIPQIKQRSPEVVVLLQSQQDPSKDLAWVLRGLVGLRPALRHPAHHLAFVAAFGESISQVLKGEQTPFGEGPWPCLNKACDGYQTRCVQVADIFHSPRLKTVVGIFECPECGFVYRRAGPDRSPEDRLRFDRVVEYGPRTRARLLELMGTAQPRAIAAELGIPRSSLYDHAARAAAEAAARETAAGAGSVSRGSRHVPHNLIEEKRAQWHALTATLPDPCPVELRQKAQRQRAWLRVHDPEFRNYCPTERHRLHTSRKEQRGARVDWEARDVQLEGRIREAASRLMTTSSSRARRVTKQLILVEAKLDKLPTGKLPRSHRALAECQEQPVSCVLRRVRGLVEELGSFSPAITYTEIAAKCGIASKYKEMPEVRDSILEALLELRGRRTPMTPTDLLY